MFASGDASSTRLSVGVFDGNDYKARSLVYSNVDVAQFNPNRDLKENTADVEVGVGDIFVQCTFGKKTSVFRSHFANEVNF